MKYLKNGKAVEVVSVLPDGQGFVVRDYFETFGDVDGEPVLELDDRVHIVKRVYDKAPTEKVDAEFASAEQRLADIVGKISEARNELRVVEQERKSVLLKLQQMPALRRLEDWVDGKVTHFVTVDYGRVRVLTKEELKCEGDEADRYRRAPCRLKLVTLFGESGGNLMWNASEYRDGSGNCNVECYMCCSEAEAKAMAAQRIDRELSADKVTWLEELIKSADTLGHPIDSKHREILRQDKRERAQNALNQKNKEIEELRKQLLAIDPPADV
jgi:hypothetical protein